MYVYIAISNKTQKSIQPVYSFKISVRVGVMLYIIIDKHLELIS